MQMSKQEMVTYVNGEIVPDSEAKISVHDTGFTAGDAVFDTTRTFGHKIFRLKEHLARFEKSLKYQRLVPPISIQKFADISMEVLERNLPLLGENDDCWVTQRVTRGTEEGPGVVIECKMLPFEERAKFYRDGLPLITPSIRRTPPQSISPRAKMHQYVNIKQGTLEVQAQNPDALAMLLDINGNIAEGPGSNFFIVRDGVVITPREQNVLAGISRGVALELAQELDIETIEADIDLYDAYTADECFVTSTSYCICPVSSINGSSFGEETIPGPVTDRLQKAYSGLVGIDVVQQYLSRLDS
jgi:branched-chain amino acid aminotransferase